MVAKLASIFEMVANVLRLYPAISAALVNLAVVVAGHYGLHITANQLVADVGVLDVLFGVIVHSNVTPVAKVPDRAASK